MPFDALVHADEETAMADRPLSLNVRMPDGGVLSPPVKAGDRILDALAAFGLAMQVDAEGVPCRSRVGSTSDDSATRLLGRLVMTPELDGLELELPWDALVPQTYWVAG